MAAPAMSENRPVFFDEAPRQTPTPIADACGLTLTPETAVPTAIMRTHSRKAENDGINMYNMYCGWSGTILNRATPEDAFSETPAPNQKTLGIVLTHNKSFRGWGRGGGDPFSKGSLPHRAFPPHQINARNPSHCPRPSRPPAALKGVRCPA